MGDAPSPPRSPSAQDERGQTKISDYFSVVSSAHASKRPLTPCQSVTKSSPAKRLKSNEEEGVEDENNPNTELMDFEAEEDDTVSHSLATEIGESVTDTASGANHVDTVSLVEKPNATVTFDVNTKKIKMNPSKTNINDERKASTGKYWLRPTDKDMDIDATLTKEGDTMSHAFATGTGESILDQISAALKGRASLVKKPNNDIAISDIGPNEVKTSPSNTSVSDERRVGKYSLRPVVKDLDVDVTLTKEGKEGDAVSHSIGTETGESASDKVSAAAHVDKLSCVEKPKATATTSDVDAEKVKTKASIKRERKARRRASKVKEDSDEDAVVAKDDHNLTGPSKASMKRQRKKARKRAHRLSEEESDEVADKDDHHSRKKVKWWGSGDESAPENGNGGGKFSSSAHQSTSSLNLEFYRNKVRSVPDGDFIENILSTWKDDFKKLERHHGYIQWLFPLKEIGMNNMAQVLSDDEAKAIREDAVLKERVLRAYKMMLYFYGLVLTDDEVGKVGPSDLYEKRMDNLNQSFHNNLRITRILKALGELGFEHLKKPLLVFLIKEAFMKNTLVNCRRSCVTYWIPTLQNKEEQKDLEKMAKDLEKTDKRRTPKFFN